MEQYGRSSEGSRSDPSPEWAGPGAQTGLEEPMWQLGLGAAEESYPQRPDEADCTYYLRTGFCGFGSRCRYNHPRDRGMVVGAERAAGEYPERVGQPVCQYYMRTRTCKFGSSCKYHHPRLAGGAVTPVSLNYYGYPLRPGEKECSYYVKTGQCKFGATCKFHHPVPAGVQIPAPSPVAPVSPLPVPVPSPIYSTMQPPPGPSSQQIGVLVARPPLLPGSLVQSPYGPVVLSPAMVPISGWGPYQASGTGAVLPSGTPNVGSAQLYGMTQLPSSAAAYPGPYQLPGSLVGPSSSNQKEQAFPERSNQQDYQYYPKTGEVKGGPSYRHHPPPEMTAPKANVTLSPGGLPLRPFSEISIPHRGEDGARVGKFVNGCIGTKTEVCGRIKLGINQPLSPYIFSSSQHHQCYQLWIAES
ncbi:zinc finger CCCH domain-containing protein 34 isoform X3 [Vigna radiata var. radiata]|uniref:Zinc finger CCCH domain-containing protein 34 isoform X3 n=1 Tax=Vigna radiata var. radiata TaxID=3916 RepID=A0A3Q0FK44_VIGRR|nr:zinc finger CCCH domain-containing protein 34 isoform X3 [Vigna radiata var. radiata]